ncbi:hypothetical protein GIB67_010654 [Kingdonia uniflora]|uniref:DUF668 domain-containing protein n=1 Tax=Kingdonia uniflora TaxID=39325 RepID=A0A7J7MN25_9MAGN|nr:hypothetical protein GIB67_010654 [Kingdonia uniflora]
MALETWLVKVKTAISKHNKMAKKSHVGILAFEIAGLMTKLQYLWQSLSDKNIQVVPFEGVRKIVSNDETFLLSLACAEIVENLRVIAKSVSRFGEKSNDSSLRCFERLFEEFANSNRDPHCWVLCWKEMEAKQKKMEHYVTITANLYREIDELSEVEHGLKKLLQLQCSNSSSSSSTISNDNLKKLCELEKKVFWQRQEVKYLKESSLWNRSFDMITLLLARSVFTVFARIKLVFGIGSHGSLQRSLSVLAAVYPLENSQLERQEQIKKFFRSNSKLLKPPPTTLGAAAFSLHYANVIIVLEKMIKSPHLVGIDARDDLYGMLPTSVRVSLRGRLRGVGFSASDPVLAGEWRDALGKILSWLSPLAHNMIKWQSERSFEQQNLMPRTNVFLLQTLFFANQAKTEAAITELLVGLNYIWRFEREMNAKTLLECSNINGYQNLPNSD